MAQANPWFPSLLYTNAMGTSPPLEPLQIGPYRFHWGSRTYIMGVINMTPDSFSGDGLWPSRDAALRLAEAHVEAGADLIDIGGESTRPGAAAVDAEEELRRVLPLIQILAPRLAVPVSVDTSKAVVAKAALEAGALIVNDVWGFRHDPALPDVTARAGAAVVLMENGRDTTYHDLIEDVAARLDASTRLAAAAGVARERIILDPGLGFGKRAAESLTIVRRLGEFRRLGYPLLVGPSRKGTIGKVLGLPVQERLEGTAAMVAIAIANGADLVRVHDVQAMARVARMADAIVRAP